MIVETENGPDMIIEGRNCCPQPNGEGIPKISCSRGKRVWIESQMDGEGNRIEGHYIYLKGES